MSRVPPRPPGRGKMPAGVRLGRSGLHGYGLFARDFIPEGWRVLGLQRAPDTRCPAAWESIHGHIEPGENPPEAAVRELREEAPAHRGERPWS